MQALMVPLLAAGAPTLTAGASLLGGIGGLMSTFGQASALRASAQANEDNASRALFRSQVDAQDQDMAAKEEIASYVSSAAFSGFSISSDYFQQGERRLKVLARRDALRLRNQGDLQAANYRSQAASDRASAKNLSLKGILDFGGSMLSAGSSLLSPVPPTTTAPGV